MQEICTLERVTDKVDNVHYFLLLIHLSFLLYCAGRARTITHCFVVVMRCV